MIKKINRIIKAKSKVMYIFAKMIKRLEKANNKLAKLHQEAIDEISYHRQAENDAINQIKENDKSIKKIKEFLE